MRFKRWQILSGVFLPFCFLCLFYRWFGYCGAGLVWLLYFLMTVLVQLWLWVCSSVSRPKYIFSFSRFLRDFLAPIFFNFKRQNKNPGTYDTRAFALLVFLFLVFRGEVAKSDYFLTTNNFF